MPACKTVNIKVDDVLLTMTMVNDRPILPSKREPHINKTKLSGSNINLVLGS
jgi:hypothetical protein